jgi:DNA-binding winged helix-turn-helix (wHTH) protein
MHAAVPARKREQSQNTQSDWEDSRRGRGFPRSNSSGENDDGPDEFQLDQWLVIPELNRIEGLGRIVRIEPKMMEVLVELTRHAGRVVSKERLIQAVWADTFVTDDVLTRCISGLRKALSDDATKPKVIETIPRRGYQLMVPPRYVRRDDCRTAEHPQTVIAFLFRHALRVVGTWLAALVGR